MKHIEYFKNIKSILNTIEKNCSQQIEAASVLFSNAIESNKKIFLFGTGHSHMLAEELFYRAGGLLNVQPIFVEELMLHKSASESTAAERKEGLAKEIFDCYKITKDDVIVIISNSGRNGVVIDMALLCKERGISVIALTSITHSNAADSRHPCGKRLWELADIVLDNCGCHGDACIEIDGVQDKICATSTVAGAAILNAVVARAVEICSEHKFYPDHFRSANVDGGDEANSVLIEKYRKEIMHL